MEDSVASDMAVQIPGSSDPIPTYQIDLSLPPSERYVQLTTNFKTEMQNMKPLFDQVLTPMIPSPRVRGWIKFLAWLFLRHVYSPEETAELQGIAKTSGIDIFYFIALNVLLDSMLGCTSGAVMTIPKGSKTKGKEKGVIDGRRMMHFRTLDWGMEPLRSVLVVLEFVRSKSEEPKKVIGRSITYAGYTGVLTGVRENMSISLNFRPNHECSTFKLRIHQLAVLFGLRPSISSVIRSAIFPSTPSEVPTLEDMGALLSQQKTSPCYLTICNGISVSVLEKDLLSAKIRSSGEFLVHTNNDTSPTSTATETHNANGGVKSISAMVDDITLEDFIKDSKERRACVEKKWHALRARQKRQQASLVKEENEIIPPAVREETLIGWVKKNPTMNEQSHFGCVMDSSKGKIRWLERGVYSSSKDERDLNDIIFSDDE